MHMHESASAQIAVCDAVVSYLRVKSVVESTKTSMDEKFQALWELGHHLMRELEPYREPN